ncbi:adhesion G-protein coupled receptor F1 isoform X2 [Amphiprion ocellaris]|uniref:adhesion G-protein coupled receptor F1 isoform X2 n=1 Tax=Amphiprion ocellaris TaxID=80972 RepID=UPI00241150DD|nr:adhesion G-protein coupled receptor F1 isoform X2 [Amphiprion ocellaris]
MHAKKTRNMMWTFIFLSILSLNVCQAAAQENSTQKYYVKLKIDKNAIGNITELLRPFVDDTNLSVDDLKMTTECKEDSAGVKCSCKPNHRWSDDVCWSNKTCCGDSECTFPTNSDQMCVSVHSVAVSGSLTLGQNHSNCLRESTSEEYKKCNDTLFIEMKRVYSTIRGFVTLTITGYRIGSIIADFKMNIDDRVYSNDLIETTLKLSEFLPATLNLETAGFVRLYMPLTLVCYEKSVVLRCQSTEDLNVTPKWNLKRPDRIFDITSGTIADVAILGKRETNLTIREVSELWEGNYTCTYEQQRSLVTIVHKATGILDVSLLPNIYTSTQPPFVRCESERTVVKVTAKCEISKSSEPYEVTWTGDGILQKPLYKMGEKFCEAEGDWYDTKADFTAELKCKHSAGVRLRYCSEDGEWEKEDSRCVITELYSALQQATIVDIGLGFEDQNVADVLSIFENTTNNTENINTFTNVNVSVHVLSTLDDKLESLNNESSTDYLLESSSNLLERSLNKSWMSPPPDISLTLAETYLSSLERLIKIANITGNNRKPNIEVDTCSDEEECKNSVFNVNVSLKHRGGGIVKTTGFKQLESYLPYDGEKKLNSIIVSTTTNESTDEVEITIDFPLRAPRPRHVELECVAWNTTNRRWSSDRCKWARAANEGRCTCTHLSSFAILLSKHPINVPGATEMTCVGLSVSIISLTLSLLIELVVWGDVVKTNTLHLRHTAHVNISVCLLVGNCCFLASVEPRDLSRVWCKTFTVLKHFCYLSMFFWMLCLSTTLLHQTLYLFHQVSRTKYLRFSMIVGYVCPLLIVFVTFLTNNSGGESSYYRTETCWLVYIGLMKGSIFTFVIPVGIIVFVNIFSMLVVIMKLLYHQENIDKSREKEKTAAKTVLRTVVFLTPVFGVTWIFGLAVLIVDLTSGTIAFIVNYVFIFMNAFQGLFILLTTCLGDRTTRDALLKRFKKKAVASTSNNIVKSASNVK